MKALVKHDPFYDSICYPYCGSRNTDFDLDQRPKCFNTSVVSQKPKEIVVPGDSPEQQSKPSLSGPPLSKPYQEQFAS